MLQILRAALERRLFLPLGFSLRFSLHLWHRELEAALVALRREWPFPDFFLVSLVPAFGALVLYHRRQALWRDKDSYLSRGLAFLVLRIPPRVIDAFLRRDVVLYRVVLYFSHSNHFSLIFW